MEGVINNDMLKLPLVNYHYCYMVHTNKMASITLESMAISSEQILKNSNSSLIETYNNIRNKKYRHFRIIKRFETIHYQKTKIKFK